MANTPFYLVSLLLLLGAFSAFHQQVLTKLTTYFIYVSYDTNFTFIVISVCNC